MNIFSRLRSLLPEPPLQFGRVLEIHDDDTSTIQLPLGLGSTPYAPGLESGSTIRARGSSVEVGANAFVRGGVIESRAPDGAILDIEIGAVVPSAAPPSSVAFSGTIPAILFPVGAAHSVSLSGYWSGGYPAYTYSTNFFLLPPGIILNAATGTLAGTASAASPGQFISVTATDQTGTAATSNAFSVSAA